MTTESDLIFDNMYEDLSPLLDQAIEEAIEAKKLMVYKHN